jgi:ubiquinone/menaquinone biosynthesis C-methylase UbiE
MTDMVDTMTERLLTDAGVGAGMRVLDVGCGRGELSRLIARRVGEGGQVLGVDRDPEALALARERAPEPGSGPITYVEAELGGLPAGLGSFDAVVGRRVLMYVADAVAVMRGLAALLRPGGLVAFQEHDATMVPASRVRLPLHEQAHGWMWRTVEREGGNLGMGFELTSVFERAGLVVEAVRAEAIVQTPRSRRPTAMIVQAMLHRIVRHGVADPAEIDVDTLDARLAAELAAANTVYIGDMVFCAWARKPG